MAINLRKIGWMLRRKVCCLGACLTHQFSNQTKPIICLWLKIEILPKTPSITLPFGKFY